MNSARNLTSSLALSGCEYPLSADQSFLEAIPCGLLMSSPDGLIVRANRKASDLLDFSSLPIDARFLRSRLFEADGTPFAETKAFNAVGAIRNRHVVIHGEDGVRTFVSLDMTPIADTEGNQQGFVICLTETGERVDRGNAGPEAFIAKTPADATASDAERLLRETANQFLLVAETVPVLIFNCDTNQRFKFVNRLLAGRFGLTPGECVGKTVAEIVGPINYANMKARIEAVLGGKPAEFELEIVYPGPGRRFKHCAFAPERDASGSVIGFVAAIADISDRIRHETALRENEVRFRAIVETTPECVKLVAPDGTLLHMNSSGLEMFGATEPGDVIGKSFFNFIATYDREAFRAFNERVCRGEKDCLEFDTISINGHRRKMESHAAPFPNPDGTLVQLAVTRDVTVRKQIEEELRASRNHLRLTTEAANIGTWQWDITRNELFWSPIHKEMWGIPADQTDVTYDDWVGHIIEHDLDRAKDAVELCFRGEADYDVEYRIRRRGESQIRWIRSAGQAIFDEDGAPKALLGISQDVSERKFAEDRLRRSEAEFRTLADNMLQFAWMTDASGWVYWYNKRWFDYTGTTIDDMRGWGWQKVHHPDHVERVVRKISHCFETGEFWEDTFPIRSKDGEYRWFLSRAVPIHDRNGRIERWFGTNTDITDRLKAEEQRTVLINELNHRVKNTLATVQAIAAQTLRGAETAPDIRMRLEQRLMALSNAHNILTTENWEGAEIHQIIHRSLEPHADLSRLDIQGPPIRLSPKAALAIAMAVHELATNAAKYGALSNDNGRISIRWSATGTGDPLFSLTWEETGGPPVSPPSKRGFGSRLIERNLAHDLDGAANIDYREQGLVCEVSCRQSALSA